METLNEKGGLIMSEVKETVNVPVEEVVETPEVPVEQPKATKKGVVSNCNRLNVRKSGKRDAEVVGIIDRGTEVSINDKKSTDEWLNISVKGGVKGFCMKKFINILP